MTGEIAQFGSVYGALALNLEFDSNNYFLYKGVWYQIENDFYGDIYKSILNLKESDIPFPKFEYEITINEQGRKHRTTEAKYNETLANQISGSKLFDMGTGQLGYRPNSGSSFIEIADVVTAESNFIHVKVFNSGSKELIHQIAQMLASTISIASDTEMRSIINDEFPTGINPATSSLNGSTVTLAIIVLNERDIFRDMPFLAALNLYDMIQSLKKYGCKLERMLIRGIEKPEIHLTKKMDTKEAIY